MNKADIRIELRRDIDLWLQESNDFRAKVNESRDNIDLTMEYVRARIQYHSMAHALYIFGINAGLLNHQKDYVKEFEEAPP